MAWDKSKTQLNDYLASMMPFPQGTLPFLADANINPGMIDFSGTALTFWYNIISYADSNRQLMDLVNALLAKRPNDPFLLAFKEPLLQDYSLGPDIKNVDWKGNVDEEMLEKITDERSTLLPIRFLSIGLEKAKSVARVVVERNNKRELGSGFLICNNVFVTNHHVIRDKETASIARIEFNYEESVDGNPYDPTVFALDPENGFATSKEDDWTAVRIKGDANKDFGALPLSKVSIAKGDFVNIIQHPGGRYKEVGLYHNMVMYCDESRVQYLTDTEGGSSGSPVFDSEWEIVALHHSGGMMREPNSQVKLLRNQGIHINRVIEGLSASVFFQ